MVRFLSALCLGALLSSWTGPARSETISIGINPTVFDTLKADLKLTGSDPVILQPKSCPSLESDSFITGGRALVEVSILCNAIFDAKLADRLQIIHSYPHKRRLSEISAGRIDVSGTTIFPEVFDTLQGNTQPRFSDAIVRVGEFEKAIFTVANRTDVLAVRSLEDLQSFTGVMVKYWAVDMLTLNSMKLKGVVAVSRAELYPKFFETRRADFTISEFSSIETQPWAKNLKRVPGVKVSLVSPRIRVKCCGITAMIALNGGSIAS
ncbi:hypothetical protein ACFL12_06310, partial [Pseudomonadota bacterium]